MSPCSSAAPSSNCWIRKAGMCRILSWSSKPSTCCRADFSSAASVGRVSNRPSGLLHSRLNVMLRGVLPWHRPPPVSAPGALATCASTGRQGRFFPKHLRCRAGAPSVAKPVLSLSKETLPKGDTIGRFSILCESPVPTFPGRYRNQPYVIISVTFHLYWRKYT